MINTSRHVAGCSRANSGLSACASTTSALFPRNSIKPAHSQHASPCRASPHTEHDECSVLEADRRAVLLSSLGVLLAPYLYDSSFTAAQAATNGINKVFVAGATGSTGRRVVQQLRAKGFEVRAGCRDVKKAQSLGLALDSSVTLVQANVTGDRQALVDAIGDAQAVICATGYTGFNPAGFKQVDETGTINLVEAAKAAGVSRFVLMSSLLTNAREVGQQNNPAFKFLNLFGGVLDHKHVAELYLKDSGLDYTIVRPSGLSDEPASKMGNLVVGKEDTLFGLPTDPGGSISRDTVAEVLVAALTQPSSSRRVVEVEASPNAAALPEAEWFSA